MIPKRRRAMEVGVTQTITRGYKALLDEANAVVETVPARRR